MCGYSEYSNDYRNFRISSIENKDKEYVDLLKNNFDPFFSAGKKLKVRLTENGKKRYERIISNRPKLLEKEEEDVWGFEVSEFKAELYFWLLR